MTMTSGNRTRPTLRDVAREAAVSIWTASNAFSNPDRVAAATRQRVLAAADCLGYLGPNPGARALALGRSHLIAFATGAEPEHLLSDPAAALIAQGVLTVCSRAGLSVVLTDRDEGLLVDGRVAFRVPATPARRPTVTIADSPLADAPTVCPDLDPGVALLADYLTGLGHRHVALLSVVGDDERIASFGRHFHVSEELPVLRSSADTPWPTHGAGEAQARRALRSSPRPTALIATSDVLAAGALHAAHGMGLRVPDDVSIVTIDDTPSSEGLALTGVVVPYRPMGELAARLVIDRIDGDSSAHSPPPLATTLAIRRSAGPAPAG